MARKCGVTLGAAVSFLGFPIISRTGGSQIHIGTKSVLISTSAATALGVRSRIVLRTLRPGARIEIGDDAGISGSTICAAVSVVIGKRCLIGADCMIFDTDFHNHQVLGSDALPRRYSRPDWPAISAPVQIGDDVFLGTRTIVCKGVTIGNGTIVAAGSVVSKNLPANCIAAGVPAKVVRLL
jgi:acetyltransferase-like isoleucine patch superfamily enzyme